MKLNYKLEGNMKHILIFFLFSFLFFLSSIANAIEVGGHLTEDTTWSPDNNPYLVTSVLYVDDDVTLYIEPGTQIFLNAALFNNNTMIQNFAFHVNSEPIAKMFWVNGRIIAEGTEQDSILFSRIQQDSTYFKWGTIHLSEQAELSRFKHCRFEHAAKIIINLTFQPMGAISVQNSVLIDNCYFIDSRYGIKVYYPVVDVKMEVTNSFFTIDEGIDPNTTDWGKAIQIQSYDFLPNRIWIANNEFHNRSSSFGEAISIVNNKFCGNGMVINSDILPNYVYSNYFYNAQTAISANANEDEAGIYIKNNVIEADPSFYCRGIKLNDYGYYEVSDNIVYGGIESSINSHGKVFNNRVHNNPISNSYNGLDLGGYYDIFNNIVMNSYTGLNVGWRVLSVYNNAIINNSHALGNLAYFGDYFINSIFIGNEELVDWPFEDTLYVKNCIIDSIPEGYVVSGENNIQINEDQIESIFVDFANNDFHLAEGSIAIDAGFDTLGYYYPFDLENSVRVWDGDGDGNAVIDIGAYEYGAPPLGRIIGYITETESGNPVDYVKLLVDNEPGEFTFADSIGYFELQLPEGTYDIYAERVFYEDNVIYTVTVNNEDITEIEFNMTYNDPLVSVENEEIQSVSGLNLGNYPNPFNPSTTISYTLAEDSQVELTVYNIKGQKVKTLVNKSQQAGTRSVEWSGNDDNNNPVSSGIYFYKITTDTDVEMGKMILLK